MLCNVNIAEYRNAVALDEVEDDFTSTIRMKNSPELVDWALSHIPKSKTSKVFL